MNWTSNTYCTIQSYGNSRRDPIYLNTEKAAISEEILSICSEFYQIGTPHFSLSRLLVQALNAVFNYYISKVSNILSEKGEPIQA